MLKALTLALTLHMSAVHAAPPKVDSKAVATAKAHLASAKAELKSAKASERARKQTSKRAKRHRIKAEHDRIMALPDDAPELGADLGCGTCQDNHDGSCTCE